MEPTDSSGRNKKRNNHRNRKRRKNRKQNINKLDLSPDEEERTEVRNKLEHGIVHEVSNKLSLKDELSIAEANRVSVTNNKPPLVKQDEIDIQESNKYIGPPNKSTTSAKKDVDSNHGQVDVEADVNADDSLGENNQNIFNVEPGGAISNSNVVVSNNGGETILQSVSTN
uniref:Uncharacterized protein n=1 Tax=Cacopsylla melanoneura TaxID=428564 RepID=A0A8D8YKE4_9HEMI